MERLPRNSFVVELAGASINKLVVEWFVGEPNLLHMVFGVFRRLIVIFFLNFI